MVKCAQGVAFIEYYEKAIYECMQIDDPIFFAILEVVIKF